MQRSPAAAAAAAAAATKPISLLRSYSYILLHLHAINHDVS